MQLYPAIDIRHGSVVRLVRGEADQQTVYASDPVVQAQRFAAEGAAWIHVVDLDRAFGEGDNFEVLRRIAASVGGVRVQAGGGFRSAAAISDALEAGIARIVLGTQAIVDPDFLDGAVRAVGAARLAVALDARDGVVQLRGWRESGGERVDSVARRALGFGVRTVIYTDIGRDGMLAGPDIDGAGRLAALGCDVIASGGVASLDDLRAIGAAGLAGAIVGRALYEGRFTLGEALACASSS
ncbi:MAG: 1-(5-phosphoribosyl)-5-[(5-phosphoribosylamino)methylideneamino] imidazole-4-carboxamide isomerase [Gemmatimonadales bacterium]|nr:1-(5-phosphoribosyl)-5-[(5-phosphoribosylamino)methylideneamino] imidazole-4-carboxamide isomerase [Gemmatimonadales bacterium]